MSITLEKQLKSISSECWDMRDSNKKLWNEIFRLGIQAERNRLKLRSGGRK